MASSASQSHLFMASTQARVCCILPGCSAFETPKRIWEKGFLTATRGRRRTPFPWPALLSPSPNFDQWNQFHPINHGTKGNGSQGGPLSRGLSHWKGHVHLQLPLLFTSYDYCAWADCHTGVFSSPGPPASEPQGGRAAQDNGSSTTGT